MTATLEQWSQLMLYMISIDAYPTLIPKAIASVWRCSEKGVSKKGVLSSMEDTYDEALFSKILS